MYKRNKRVFRSWFAAFLLLVLLSLSVFSVRAEEGTKTPEASEEKAWVNFFLVCNEGMSNDGGNVGNTMMVLAMNPMTGVIRMLMFTWDTFVEYEGYDIPQKIDMAYRNNGPEETMKVFNQNFDTKVDRFLSLNYLNLGSMIDRYGGVTVDVTRAERNALNSMVASKKENIQAMQDTNILEEFVVELLADEYFLNDFGPETHLNGLQAVGYGWLQYDSVYNCCLREVEVIASLFRSVSNTLKEEVAFYTNDTDKPKVDDMRRIINLDDVSEDDMTYLMREISPIFDMSYNNLPEEDIKNITLALARTSYLASRQGADILDLLESRIFPLEAKEPYEMVAGTRGHVIDYKANSEEMKEFLYGER